MPPLQVECERADKVKHGLHVCGGAHSRPEDKERRPSRAQVAGELAANSGGGYVPSFLGKGKDKLIKPLQVPGSLSWRLSRLSSVHSCALIRHHVPSTTLSSCKSTVRLSALAGGTHLSHSTRLTCPRCCDAAGDKSPAQVGGDGNTLRSAQGAGHREKARL